MLALRMVAVKNSMKRLPAFSPASAMTAGRIDAAAGGDALSVLLTSSVSMSSSMMAELSHNPLYETAF